MHDANSDPFADYHALLAKREFDQAVKVMQRARDENRIRGQSVEAAAFGSLMAAALSLAGNLRAAEDAYRQAEADSPANPLLKLQLANFLVDKVGEPERALQEIEEVLPALRADRSTYHAAESSLGTIYAALGRIADAEHSFRELVRPAWLPGKEPRAYDFRLANALVARGAMLDECQAYAEVVAALAAEQGDEDAARPAQILIESIRKARFREP